jgi:hypothetical protein
MQIAKFLLDHRKEDGEIDWDSIIEASKKEPVVKKRKTKSDSESDETGSTASSDRPQCMGRKMGDEIEGFSPKVYENKQCNKKALKGCELCKVCQKNSDASNKSWHGRIDEGIPATSHIIGSEWFETKFPEGMPVEKKSKKVTAKKSDDEGTDAEEKPKKEPKKKATAKKTDDEGTDVEEKPKKAAKKKAAAKKSDDEGTDAEEKPKKKAAAKKPAKKAAKKEEEESSDEEDEE